MQRESHYVCKSQITALFSSTSPRVWLSRLGLTGTLGYALRCELIIFVVLWAGRIYFCRRVLARGTVRALQENEEKSWR